MKLYPFGHSNRSWEELLAYRQCRRRLIADALTVAGHEVHHIQTREHSELHKLTPFARVVDGRLIYDRGTQVEM